MAKPNGDQGSGHWRDIVIFAIFAIFAIYLSALGVRVQPFPRVPGYQLGNNGTWKDLDDALAMPSALGDLRISPNIDQEGQYNVRLVDQPQAIQEPMPNIDADNVAPAEADLELWLAVAEVASLPRQIERDEANMIVRRPHVPSCSAESGMAPSSLVDDAAARAAPQNLPPQSLVAEAVAADAPAPDVLGILPRDLLQRIEDEAPAEAQVEAEVAIEDFPPGMLELISEVASFPQVAAAPDALGLLPRVLLQRIEGEAHDEAQVEAEVATGDYPPGMLEDVASFPQVAAAPDVLGLLPRVLLQRIEDEAHDEAQVEAEVATEDYPPGMLRLISDVASFPQVAAPSMSGPAGGLESNLEERMPVDHPEAGDSPAEVEAEVNKQDDVENLEVEEPHAEGMQ